MIPELVSAFILAVVGVALAAWGGSEALDGYRTRAWPETTGMIDESRGSDTKKPAIDYYHLSYTYVVDGVPRVGHKLRFGHEGKDGARLQRRYPVGSKVPVYYDPADPTQAVLERGTDDLSPKLKGFIALALLALAVWKTRSALAERRAAADGARRA